MKIGFDLDDVLLDFNTALISYAQRVHNMRYKRENIISYDYRVVWKCSEEKAKKIIFGFYKSPEHKTAKPIQGARLGIETLKKNNELFVISSKPEHLRQTTMEWLNKHFPKMFVAVYLTNHFHGNGKKQTKGGLCGKLGIETFVEDAPEHAKNVAEIGIPVILFNTPWNQGVSDQQIKRAFNWRQIVSFLTEKNK
jgi:uncharacterized HAD superfamily protein